MKDIDKMSDNELRAEVRVLRPVYEAAKVIDKLRALATFTQFNDLHVANAAVEAQDD